MPPVPFPDPGPDDAEPNGFLSDEDAPGPSRACTSPSPPST